MVEVNYLFLLLATALATAAPVTETDRTSDIVCAESLGRQKYGTKEILGEIKCPANKQTISHVFNDECFQ